MSSTRSNENLLESRKRNFLPTAFHYHKEALQLVKARGTKVWDEKGREYLDCIGGIVCISAGHNHPKIKQALMQMLDQDEIQHTSLIYLSKYPVELAEKLTKLAPNGIDKVALVNSGSEANELAFLAARNKTGEQVVMHLQHSYHGGTSGTLATCGHHTWRFKAQPTTSVTAAPAPYCYRCPYNKTPDSCALECAKEVERTIQTTTSGKIAAFIAEPVMGVGGFITPPKEYFDLVTKTVHNYGGVYISDEVQTGAGRTGNEFFFTKDFKIDADMITMAKGLGNGAAIGAVMMKSEIAAPLSGKVHFNTFGGDPYQTKQASLTIDVIEEERLIENAKAQGTYLKDQLQAMAKKHKLIGEVRGRGLMLGLELVKDQTTKAYASEETVRLMDLCKAKGVLTGKGGLYGNVLRITPPLTITRAECDQFLKALDESFVELGQEFARA